MAEHHTLVAGTANLVVGAQSDISGLGVDAALNLHGIGTEAVVGIYIADFADCFLGNCLVVNHCLGGDFTADQTEIGGDHGFAGHTGVGILSQAGVQDRIGNGVSNLVGVTVGDTLRGK